MEIKVPKLITLQKFAQWIREYTSCELRVDGSRLKVVVFADNIAPGYCVPLHAEASGEEVMISEVAGDFYSPDKAWQALESDSVNLYPPTPFHQWVADQYLTAAKVTIKKFSFSSGA